MKRILTIKADFTRTVAWLRTLHQTRPLWLGVRILCLMALLAVLPAPTPAAEWLLTGELGSHDPCLLKEDGTYANGNWWWSPATGMGLAMKFSTDGIKWRQGLPVFTSDNMPAWWTDYAPNMKPFNVWAPDIHKFGGRYWLYYSISEFGKNNSAIGLTSSTGIFQGDWREDGVVVFSRKNFETFNAVDPSLAIDADGNPWLSFGSYFDGIHIVRLDPQTMKPVSGEPYTTIARRQSDLGLEGSTVIYANGFYYLFVAVDICCNGKVSTHKIAYGRSKKITGPYAGKESDLANTVSNMMTGSLTIFERGDDRWAGMGGPFIYRRGDGWIIARHGYDKNMGGVPKIRISDLYWDTEGWPTYKAPELLPKTP